MIEKLLSSLKRKSRKAQEEFYKRYSARMFSISYRYVINEQDAGSIVNNGFYKIFANIDKLTDVNEQQLIGWMKRIVINVALMLLRSRARYPELKNAEEEIIVDAEITDESLVLEDYYNLIKNLSNEVRTVFNLYAIDGYSHKEIAAQLDIKESSSRVYLSRARKILQEKLTTNSLV